MSGRRLIVPAAGLGTRLGANAPKLLVPVAGAPMIDRVLDLHAGYAARATVVVHPSAERAVRRHLRGRSHVDVVVQPQPTGMLDAIMLALTTEPLAAASVWITWCDQVAVHPDTIAELARVSESQPEAAVILPTVQAPAPYIHFARDGRGCIVRVLQRREGDAMPPVGESDIGLFSLSRHAAVRLLPDYAAAVAVGDATRERNFLPFIPWAAARAAVVTVPSAHAMDALGVNTADDLRRVESYLASGWR